MADRVLHLVDRLRGIYTLAVDDGCGPLDGSDTFTRKYETDPLLHQAADCIEALERGEQVDITRIVAKLYTPADIFNLGHLIVSPISREAIKEILKLSGDNYPTCDGEQCNECQDDPNCHFILE